MSAVTSPLEVDVAVVGGGMVGASLAAGLAGTGVRILLIEAVPFGTGAQPSFDDRTTALGNASRRIFEALGVWPDIAPEAAAIRAIHVSDAGRFGAAHLSAEQQGVAALGYVVPNRRIGAALWGRLGRLPDITLRVPGEIREVAIDAAGVRMTVESGGRREAVAARLVVAADGAHSQIRAAAGIAATVEDYDQVAVVANVASDTPHEGNAYERFTPAGPLAVLPLADGSLGVIWACRSADAPAVLALDEAAWLATLQARFAAWRGGDRGGVVRFTDGLVKLFGDTRPGVGLLRNLGLLAFDLTPPAKSALARISLGFGGPSPRLARGLPVRHA
ncbi:MAG: FAD-dependent monooxygenase [Gammaproteobacteria bacterium]|nr:FAD-dependent monooxygenase [Gammaproteobacteria bacterium]